MKKDSALKQYFPQLKKVAGYKIRSRVDRMGVKDTKKRMGKNIFAIHKHMSRMVMHCNFGINRKNLRRLHVRTINMQRAKKMLLRAIAAEAQSIYPDPAIPTVSIDKVAECTIKMAEVMRKNRHWKK